MQRSHHDFLMKMAFMARQRYLAFRRTSYYNEIPRRLLEQHPRALYGGAFQCLGGQGKPRF